MSIYYLEFNSYDPKVIGVRVREESLAGTVKTNFLLFAPTFLSAEQGGGFVKILLGSNIQKLLRIGGIYFTVKHAAERLQFKAYPISDEIERVHNEAILLFPDYTPAIVSVDGRKPDYTILSANPGVLCSKKISSRFLEYRGLTIPLHEEAWERYELRKRTTDPRAVSLKMEAVRIAAGQMMAKEEAFEWDQGFVQFLMPFVGWLKGKEIDLLRLNRGMSDLSKILHGMSFSAPEKAGGEECLLSLKALDVLFRLHLRLKEKSVEQKNILFIQDHFSLFKENLSPLDYEEMLESVRQFPHSWESKPKAVSTLSTFADLVLSQVRVKAADLLRAFRLSIEERKNIEFERIPYPDSGELTLDNLHIGFAHAQGDRPTMEDNFSAHSFTSRGKNFRMVSLFDGHKGPEAAEAYNLELHAYVQETMENSEEEDFYVWIGNSLREGMIRMGLHCKFHATYTSGTTAITLLFVGQTVFVAGCGDSSAISVKNGQGRLLVERANLSIDKYQRGVLKRGGEITGKGTLRINGILAVGRAGGDKGIPVSPAPEVTYYSAMPGMRFCLVCDGITDVMNTKEIAAISSGEESPKKAAEQLIERAYGKWSSDNMSAIMVDIRPV